MSKYLAIFLFVVVSASASASEITCNFVWEKVKNNTDNIPRDISDDLKISNGTKMSFHGFAIAAEVVGVCGETLCSQNPQNYFVTVRVGRGANQGGMNFIFTNGTFARSSDAILDADDEEITFSCNISQ